MGKTPKQAPQQTAGHESFPALAGASRRAVMVQHQDRLRENRLHFYIVRYIVGYVVR
jgi:hypothetical protein